MFTISRKYAYVNQNWTTFNLISCRLKVIWEIQTVCALVSTGSCIHLCSELQLVHTHKVTFITLFSLCGREQERLPSVNEASPDRTASQSPTETATEDKYLFKQTVWERTETPPSLVLPKSNHLSFLWDSVLHRLWIIIRLAPLTVWKQRG